MIKNPSLREPMSMPDPYFPIKIHQCRFSGEGVTLFRHHWHEHIELLYIQSGKAGIDCNSTYIMAKPGDIIVVNSNDLHHGISLSERLFYYAIIVDLSMLHSPSVDTVETKYITPIKQNQIRFQHHLSEHSAIHQTVDQLVEEYFNKNQGYELMIKAILYQILSILLRDHVAEILTSAEQQSRMKTLERFKPVLQYIEENCHQALSVDQLASIAGISRYHFSRLFKSLTGKSLFQYIHQVRIQKADSLLHHSTMTISEIAEATGFNDIYYFSRVYKKKKAISPSKARIAFRSIDKL